MCSTCINVLHMSKMIQIRHVPDDVHRVLKSRAAKQGMPLSDYLLAELRRMAELPTLQEWLEHVETRSRVTPSFSTEEAVRAERDSR
jgi:hypothetical protein